MADLITTLFLMLPMMIPGVGFFYIFVNWGPVVDAMSVDPGSLIIAIVLLVVVGVIVGVLWLFPDITITKILAIIMSIQYILMGIMMFFGLWGAVAAWPTVLTIGSIIGTLGFVYIGRKRISKCECIGESNCTCDK